MIYKQPDPSDDEDLFFSKALVYCDIQNRIDKNEKIISLDIKDEPDIPTEDRIIKASYEDLNVYAKLCVENSKYLFEEVEIDDGELCPACGKNSASRRPEQMRANDEGTGILQRCTRRNCKKIIIISR